MKYEHRIEINRRATRVGTFEVCFPTHVALHMFLMRALASQLPFLANSEMLNWPFRHHSGQSIA